MENNLEDLWTKYCNASDELEEEKRLSSLLRVVIPLARNDLCNDFWTSNASKITEKILNDFSYKIKLFMDSNAETGSNDSFYTSYSHFKSNESLSISNLESSYAESEESLVVHLSLDRLSLSDISDNNVNSSRNPGNADLNECNLETNEDQVGGFGMNGEECRTSLSESTSHAVISRGMNVAIEKSGKRSEKKNEQKINENTSINMTTILDQSAPDDLRSNHSYDSPSLESSFHDCSFSTAPSGTFLEQSIYTNDAILGEKSCKKTDVHRLRMEVTSGGRPYGGPLLKEYKGKLATFQDYILVGNGARLLVLLNQLTHDKILAKQCDLVQNICSLIPYIISELPEQLTENSIIPSTYNILPENIFHHLMKQTNINPGQKSLRKGLANRRKFGNKLNKKAHLPSRSSSSDDSEMYYKRRKTTKEVKPEKTQKMAFLELDRDKVWNALSLVDCLRILFSTVAQHLCCELHCFSDLKRHSCCVENVLQFGSALMSKLRVCDFSAARDDMIVGGLVLVMVCGCRYVLENSNFEILKDTKIFEILSQTLTALVNSRFFEWDSPVLRNLRNENIIFISSSLFCVMRTIYGIRRESTFNCIQKLKYVLSFGIIRSTLKYFSMLNNWNEAEKLFDLIVSLIIHIKAWRSDMLHAQTCRNWYHSECKYVELYNHHSAAFGEHSTTVIAGDSKDSHECLVSFFYKFSLDCLRSCRSVTSVTPALEALGRASFCCCLPIAQVISPLLDMSCSSTENVQRIVLSFVEEHIFGQVCHWYWLHDDETDCFDHNVVSIERSMKICHMYDLSIYNDYLLSPAHGRLISAHLVKVARLGFKQINDLLFQLLRPVVVQFIQRFHELLKKKLSSALCHLIECLWVLLVFSDGNDDVYKFMVEKGTDLIKLCSCTKNSNEGNNLLRYLVYCEHSSELKYNRFQASSDQSPFNRKHFSNQFVDDLSKLQFTWRKYFSGASNHAESRWSNDHSLNIHTSSPLLTDNRNNLKHVGIRPKEANYNEKGNAPNVATFCAILSPIEKQKNKTCADDVDRSSPDDQFMESVDPVFDKLVEMWEIAARMVRECEGVHDYRSAEMLSSAKYFLGSLLRHFVHSQTDKMIEFRRNFSATCSLIRSLLTVVLILSDNKEREEIIDDVIRLFISWKTHNSTDLPKLVRVLKDCSCIEKNSVKAADLIHKCKEMIQITPSQKMSNGYDLESELCSNDTSDDEIRSKNHNRYIYSPKFATLALDLIIQNEHVHSEINKIRDELAMDNGTNGKSGDQEMAINDGKSSENTDRSTINEVSFSQTVGNEDNSRDLNLCDFSGRIFSDSNLEVNDGNENMSDNEGIYKHADEDHISAVTQCVKTLLSLCKISEEMCKQLYREGFLSKLMQGFQDILTSNRPQYHEIITTLVDLWYEVAQWEANQHDLRSLFAILKSSNPPSDLLMRALERLVKTFGDEPFYFASFKKSPFKNTAPADSRISDRKAVDLNTKELICSLHKRQKEEDISSCVASGSIVCVIPRTVDWSPSHDGFSLFAWICFSDRQLAKRHAGRYSEFMSSTPRQKFSTFKNYTHSIPSTCSSHGEREINSEDSIHILSVGHLNTIFALWLNTKNGFLCLRISNELNRSTAREEQLESTSLKQIGWHSVSLSVPKHQHRNAFITICIVIDGIEEIKCNMQLPEQRNKRQSTPNLLIIGQNDTTDCQNVANAGRNAETGCNKGDKINDSMTTHIGNVFLFRSDILSQEASLILHHLGINNQNLFIENASSELPYLIVMRPVLLKLGVNLSILCKDVAPLILPLRMNIIASYLPKAPFEYQCYTSQSPYFTDMSSVSYTICESLEPILFGKFHASENFNLEAAILKMGGISQLMFLAARVAELRCTEATISKTIGLILQAVQKVHLFRKQLHGLGGFGLVFRMFKDSFVPCGVIVLKEILESCISQSVICYRPRTGQYFVSANTNGIISDLKIFEGLLDNWRYFWLPKDDNVTKHNCIDTDGTTRLTNVGIILSSISCLVAEDSPYRLFNLVMLRKVKTLQKLLSIFEEVKVAHRSVDGICQPELLVRVVSLLMCIGFQATGNQSPLLATSFDHGLEDMHDTFHERDLNKCGLLRPVVNMEDLRCIMLFVLLLNPDELTYISTEEKHAFYLSQQHLSHQSTRKESNLLVHLGDGSRVMSSKFLGINAASGLSYETSRQTVIENGVDALAGAAFSDESARKRKPRKKKHSVSSLLSFSIPEEAEWDVNDVRLLMESSPETVSPLESGFHLEHKSGVRCHSVIISGLLDVVQDVIIVLPNEVDCAILDHCCSINLVLTLCGNSCPNVRAAALEVFGLLLRRLERENLQIALKRHVLHLLSHQLFKHGTITRDLLNAAFKLALRVPFDLETGADSTFKFRDHFPLKMFIPLLSLIPASTSDVVLCHNTLSALYNILRNNEPHMLRFFYKSHILDSLMLTLYRCIHTNDANVSDLTGESQSEIIIDDVTEILCFFVNIFAAYPVNQSYVTFCELEAQINLLARSELQRCGTSAKCAQTLLELEAKILETAILRLTVVSLSNETSDHSASTSSETSSSREHGFEKYSNFCDSETLNLLSLHLTKEVFAEDSGIESESSTLKPSNQPESNLSRTDAQIVGKLLKSFRRLSDQDFDGNVLADRFKYVLQKAIDLMFLIAPIAINIEKRCIDKFAISLMQFLGTSLQSVVKIRISKLDSSYSGKTIGFLSLVWVCQDILWNHYCHLLTLLMSPLMVERTRGRVIQVLPGSQSLIQLACSYSRKHKMLLSKFAIFLHEFMNNSKDLVSHVINICRDVLVLLEKGGINVLPPTEKGINEWTIVKEEKTLWLEEVIRMASFIRQKNSSHDERLRTNYANFFDDVTGEGTRITMKIVELQNARRKAALRSMKQAQCMNLRNVHGWRNIIETLGHERANWHFPNAQSGWCLDETEGPNRIRRRLQRCDLKIESKLFQPKVASLHVDKESCQPLEFLLQDDEAGAALSQTVESINNDENLIYMGEAALITMTVHQNGELLISGKHIYFIGGECYSVDGVSMPGVVAKYWAAETIYEIHPRRYELRDCALEIFSTTNDSIMLAFDSQQERSKVNQILHKIYMPNLVEKMSTSQATQLWRHGQITNFEYLTHLNKLAGRTLNDLMQYPVFPFVLSKYDSTHVDLADSSIYRNMSKAVSVQSPEREMGFKEHYKETESMCSDGPYHYNSHYSNSVIVLYYMIRMPPFTQLFLKFQGKKFDAPDRTFYSLWRTWQLASAESNTAMRELIPEFYYMPEFFSNSQGFRLGFRQNGEQVNHVELPSWANGDPRRFVFIHRAMLESLFVTQNLPNWIDLIFGYKQTGKAAIEAVNVFHPATYFGFDVEGSGDDLTINARKTMIRTYGQTPRQLFSSSHSSANTTSFNYLKTVDSDAKTLLNVKNIPLGIFAGTVAENDLNVNYCMTLPHDISAMKILPDGEVILLPRKTIACIFKMSKAFSIFYTISWRACDGVMRCKRQRNATILALTSFSSHNKVTCCESSGKQLWCGTKSGLIFVYLISPFEGQGDLVANPPQLPLIAHSEAISCLVISEEFKVVLSGGEDGTVLIWDYNKHTYVNSVTVDEGLTISKLAISPTLGDWVSVVHRRESSCIRYYSINAERIGEIVTPVKVIDAVFSSAPEGRSVNVLAAALRDGNVNLYSTWTLEHLRSISLPNNQDPIKSLFYTPNSHQLVIVTEGKRLYVCDSSLVKTKPLKFIVVDPF